LTTAKKLITLYNGDTDYEKYLDLSTERPGMDVRYALDDSKLRALGWVPKAVFDEELPSIVEYYKNNFIW
jgi:dTDP-glucose 4,6-dehydratase